MKVTVEEVSPVQKKLSVEIPPDVVSKELNGAYGRLKGQVRVKGFRKGKAPRSVLERMYGKEVEAEILEKLIADTLPKAIEEAGVTLILQPQLDTASDIRAGEAFSYSALLDLWPEFEVPEYKGIEIIRPSVEVTEEEIQEQMEALRKHYAKVEDLEENRPLAKGDIAIIDYTGFIDGKEADGLSEEGYYLDVGNGYFNEHFEEQMVGMAKDEEKEIVVSYPDDSINGKVAGKTVTYRVHLRDIKRRMLPELNDEFAEGIGAGFKTLEDLKERLRKQIEHDKKAAADSVMRKQIIEKITEGMDFPISERVIEAKLTQMIDNVAGHLQERGLDLEQAGITEDRLREKMRKDAEQQARTEMVLDKIAELEDISVSREDLTQYVNQHAAELNVNRDELESAIMQHIMPKLRAKKTLDFILEHANLKEEGDMPQTDEVQAAAD